MNRSVKSIIEETLRSFVNEEEINLNLMTINKNGKFDSEKLKKILIVIILNSDLSQTLIDVAIGV